MHVKLKIIFWNKTVEADPRYTCFTRSLGKRECEARSFLPLEITKMFIKGNDWAVIKIRKCSE